MSSWGKTDAAGSAPLWAAQQFAKAPTTGNRTTLFENNSANAIVSGMTVGLFNFTTSETQSGKIAHTGWVLKSTGSGGRAGRVSFQTLVCLTSNS
tara:strand:- start:2927 stop:3211 length:285 start_codon:yes stop_codon:yes gene_type:complete